jgi:hypothetical protein
MTRGRRATWREAVGGAVKYQEIDQEGERSMHDMMKRRRAVRGDQNQSAPMKNTRRSGTRDIPSKQFNRDRSFLTGEMKPFELALALDSKFGGNRSSGRTNVWTEQGSDSGGVESSIRTGYLEVPRDTIRGAKRWYSG